MPSPYIISSIKTGFINTNSGKLSMSKSAFSIRVFSIYMIVLGLALVFIPNLFLSFFAIPGTQEVWIRIVGMLVLLIAYLDFMTSRHELMIFFRWTVTARLSVPVFLTAFAILGYAPPILILFGVIDVLGAVWTAVSLQKDSLTATIMPSVLAHNATLKPWNS